MLRLARWSLFLGTAAVVLGLGKVHAKYLGFYDFTGSTRFGWSVAYILLLCVAAYGVGLPDLPKTAFQAMLWSLAAAVAAAAGISIAQFVLGSQLLPRFVVMASAALIPPLWIGTSLVAARAQRRQDARDRVLLVAPEGERCRLSNDLELRSERRATIVEAIAPLEALNGRVIDVAARSESTVVVLSREAMAIDEIVDQAAILHERGVRVRTMSLFYDDWLGKLPLSELERVALMFDIGDLHRARYGRFKRALDLVIAFPLLATLAIVTPFVLVGNLVASPGPLFYRQRRVGRNDAEFTIWKFRTMTPGLSSPTSWTLEGDDRITTFGGLLRRTHIDELPQAVNLIRGDVSTVGPRPEQPQYVASLAQSIRFYRLRHLVRPGITGWSQVKYDYGASEHDAMEKLQYDFWYLRHQSAYLDLRIIGRTIRSLVGRSGR